MQTFVETICLRDGEPQLLALHQARLVRTLAYLGVQPTPAHDLQAHRPRQTLRGRSKWRVVYTAVGIVASEVSVYVPRVVRSLQLVAAAITYAHKSTDRAALDACLAQRGTADEVLIVREGLLTDTSIANVALYDGRCWHTPRQPLLAGVQRAYLLSKGLLVERDLHHTQLHGYTHIALFNALLLFGEIVLPIAALRHL